MDFNKVDEKRRRAKERMGTGGDLYKFAEGETKVYVHPSSRPDDKHPETEGIIWVEVCLHRKLGGKNNITMCLDLVKNPILSHPELRKLVRERKNDAYEIVKRQVCPACEKLERGEIETKQVADVSPKLQWLFGFTPVAFKGKRDNDFVPVKFEPVIYISGNTVFKDLTDEIANGKPHDCTSMDAAVLMIVERVGTSFQSTDYKVRADQQTVRNPLKLDKGQRRIVMDAIKPDGSCDLLKFAAKLVKSPQRMEALLAGVDADTPQGGDDGPEQKACFGVDWVDDAECQACSDFNACAEASGGRTSKPARQPSAGKTRVAEKEQAKETVKETVVEPDAETDNGNWDPETGEVFDDEWGGDEAIEKERRAQGLKPEVTGEVFDDMPDDAPDGDSDIDPSEQPCWATYEPSDDGCKECELAGQCKEAKAGVAAQATKQKPEPKEEQKSTPPPKDDKADKADTTELDRVTQRAMELAKRSRSRKR